MFVPQTIINCGVEVPGADRVNIVPFWVITNEQGRFALNWTSGTKQEIQTRKNQFAQVKITQLQSLIAPWLTDHHVQIVELPNNSAKAVKRLRQLCRTTPAGSRVIVLLPTPKHDGQFYQAIGIDSRNPPKSALTHMAAQELICVPPYIVGPAPADLSDAKVVTTQDPSDLQAFPRYPHH
ncbi:hypothetical protein [Ferrimonas marina]|uniref:Uncharacterized protein n=1 Tax=Ferrimonas marina TaxID=299255 RepID=A0A1M5U5B5_9GAMM|nr:hypothetical protein [Ferrimonas marina]SHH58212.1 hypothetical protein SAMN02745129_2416 [Ferrimonas marina]